MIEVMFVPMPRSRCACTLVEFRVSSRANQGQASTNVSASQTLQLARESYLRLRTQKLKRKVHIEWQYDAIQMGDETGEGVESDKRAPPT